MHLPELLLLDLLFESMVVTLLSPAPNWFLSAVSLSLKKISFSQLVCSSDVFCSPAWRKDKKNNIGDIKMILSLILFRATSQFFIASNDYFYV